MPTLALAAGINKRFGSLRSSSDPLTLSKHHSSRVNVLPDNDEVSFEALDFHCKVRLGP